LDIWAFYSDAKLQLIAMTAATSNAEICNTGSFISTANRISCEKTL